MYFVTLKYTEMKNAFDIQKHRNAVVRMRLSSLLGHQEALNLMKKIIREREKKRMRKISHGMLSRNTR